MIQITDRRAWLHERRNGIGASEAPAVCGVSDFDTPLSVYLRKIGLEAERPESEAMAWGTRLEPLIAAAYSERTGRTFQGEQLFCRHPTRPWQIATLDRLASDNRVVELKTVGARAAHALGDQLGDDGSDVVPLPWRIQVTHQMVVAGRRLADVAALIGGQELRVYTVPLDERVADRVTEIEAEFWDRVRRRTPPDIDPDRDGRGLAALYPGSEGAVDLSIEAEVEAVAWEVVRGEIGRLQRAAERHKANLLAALQGAAEGRMSDGRVVARKVVTRAAYQCPGSSYVDLRIKTPKGAQ